MRLCFCPGCGFGERRNSEVVLRCGRATTHTHTHKEKNKVLFSILSFFPCSFFFFFSAASPLCLLLSFLPHNYTLHAHALAFLSSYVLDISNCSKKSPSIRTFYSPFLFIFNLSLQHFFFSSLLLFNVEDCVSETLFRLTRTWIAEPRIPTQK